MNALQKIMPRRAARTVKPDPIFGGRPRSELEFLPAALEVIETPPPPLARVASLTIVALLLVTVGWASLSHVDIVASAPGRLTPVGGSKIVQPLETGIVTAIHVHDGDQVRQGEVLVELEPTSTLADETRSHDELSAARLEVARLRAVALGASFQAPSGGDPAATAIAGHEAQAEIDDHQAKLASLKDQVAEKKAALDEARAEVSRLEALMPLAAKRAQVFQSLSDKGFGSTLQLLDAQEKQQDTAKSLEVQRRKIPELEAGVAAAERDYAEAQADITKTALADLTEAQVKADSLQADLDKAVDRENDRTLRAPVDGTVQELAIHTVGGVVEPGQMLMRVAPSNASVEVEARLANQDVGFVRAGMAAEIKVQTFPFTRYGLIHATVLSVSHDAITEDQQPRQQQTSAGAGQGQDDDASGELQYLMRLKLDRDTMNIDGRTVTLTPGMAVTAEIKTGRRRVIDFVLSPIAKASREAGRER